tara:strand:+ start:4249 stop:5133 length:885 start_codon:yes stop_codon:yes gene_type:complete
MEFNYCHDIKLINNKSLPFDIDVKGTLVKYNKKIYLTIPHAGLDVRMIIFNDKKYNHFKYSDWSENIIVEIDEKDILENQYVFKKFGVKKIEVMKKYKMNNYYCEYIKNEYFPVNMMAGNPELMFYVVKSEEENSPETGTPLHYNGTLYGIFSRYNSEKNFCYITPYLFIQKSIQNTTNYLYKCTNINSIKKINGKIVRDNSMIYCPQIQYNINLESYLLFLSNSTNRILINDNLNRYIKYQKVKKKVINNTFLLHWCKMFNKEILMEIIKNFDSRCNKQEFEINSEKHIFVYN